MADAHDDGSQEGVAADWRATGLRAQLAFGPTALHEIVSKADRMTWTERGLPRNNESASRSIVRPMAIWMAIPAAMIPVPIMRPPPVIVVLAVLQHRRARRVCVGTWVSVFPQCWAPQCRQR